MYDAARVPVCMYGVIMLRECLIDPDLSQYAIIMLDEAAQERSIHTDVLIGLLNALSMYV